jgi:hypothetical protein
MQRCPRCKNGELKMIAQSSSGEPTRMYRCDNCDYSTMVAGYEGYSGDSGHGGIKQCHWGYYENKAECEKCSYNFYNTRIKYPGMSGYGWYDPCKKSPCPECNVKTCGYNGKNIIDALNDGVICKKTGGWSGYSGKEENHGEQNLSTRQRGEQLQ